MKIAAGNRQTLVMPRQEKREWKHLKIPPQSRNSLSLQWIWANYHPKGWFHVRKSPCWNPPLKSGLEIVICPDGVGCELYSLPAFEFRFGTSFTDSSQKFGKSLILMFHFTRVELLEGLSTEKNEGWEAVCWFANYFSLSNLLSRSWCWHPQMLHPLALQGSTCAGSLRYSWEVSWTPERWFVTLGNLDISRQIQARWVRDFDFAPTIMLPRNGTEAFGAEAPSSMEGEDQDHIMK